MVDAWGGSSTGSGGNAVGDDLYRETAGNCGKVGGVTTNIRIGCRVEGLRGGGGGVVGRLGGAKRLQRNNFRPPCQESHRKLRVGGNRKREAHSSIQREVVLHSEKSECCDGDGKRPGGQMTLCGGWRCWDVDG